MEIQKHPQFIKQFEKRVRNNAKLVSKYKQRVNLFVQNPKNPLLKDHQLTGEQKDHRAFWITGDIRVVYFPVSNDTVLFINIGSHNQVY